MTIKGKTREQLMCEHYNKLHALSAYTPKDILYEKLYQENEKLEHENLLLKIAVAELRDQVDALKKGLPNE